MSTVQDVHPSTTDERLDVYERDGYVVLPSILAPDALARIHEEMAPLLAASPLGRNDFEGFASNRVYALLRKAPSVAAIVEHPDTKAMLDRLLLPGYLLSANLAINLLSGETAQNYHIDDGFYPLPRPRPAVSVSVIWAIDAFTAENGATEVIPGSHRWGSEQPALDDDRAVKVIMPSGSAVVFSGQLWHRGGANNSDARRLAISPQFCQPWARQQENMMFSVGDAALNLSANIQSMIGYSIHPPFMGHIDGMHPLRLLDPAYTGAHHGHAAKAAALLEGRSSDGESWVRRSTGAGMDDTRAPGA